jgi:hypothetical protein
MDSSIVTAAEAAAAAATAPDVAPLDAERALPHAFVWRRVAAALPRGTLVDTEAVEVITAAASEFLAFVGAEAAAAASARAAAGGAAAQAAEETGAISPRDIVAALEDLGFASIADGARAWLQARTVAAAHATLRASAASAGGARPCA